MNIFAAVFDKSVLDPLLEELSMKKARPLSKDSTSTRPSLVLDSKFNFLGTVGTVKYLKSKGFKAKSVVNGFDFDGRLKSIDKKVFAGILAEKSKKSHIAELKKLKVEPIDIVIVDLYKPKKKGFPESMDIGGQALIRSAIKNFKNVALAYDKTSILNLAKELEKGEISLTYRKKQAIKAAKFVAERGKLEAKLIK